MTLLYFLCFINFRSWSALHLLQACHPSRWLRPPLRHVSHASSGHLQRWVWPSSSFCSCRVQMGGHIAPESVPEFALVPVSNTFLIHSSGNQVNYVRMVMTPLWRVLTNQDRLLLKHQLCPPFPVWMITTLILRTCNLTTIECGRWGHVTNEGEVARRSSWAFKLLALCLNINNNNWMGSTSQLVFLISAACPSQDLRLTA